MEEVAATIREWLDLGWRTAFARVIDVQGFGGSSQVELFAMNELGNTAGGLLAGTIDDVVIPSARAMLTSGDHAGLEEVVGDAHGETVVQAGLSCGGTAHVLVQAADDVPRQLWTALVEQRPVALATVIEGPAADPRALVVAGGGDAWGSLGDPIADQAAVTTASALLADGIAAIRRIESSLGTVLVEGMVPPPRLVVVGGGSLADALVFQGAVLGWQGRVASNIEAADAALAWAGRSGAVVVLSHVPSLDAPALAAAIGHGAFYLGALGSRRTQTPFQPAGRHGGSRRRPGPDPGAGRPRSRRPDTSPDCPRCVRRDPGCAHRARRHPPPTPGRTHPPANHTPAVAALIRFPPDSCRRQPFPPWR